MHSRSGSKTATGRVEQTGARAEVQCPGCGSGHPHRLERQGFLQKKIFPKFGYYPWMCGTCKMNFLTRKRYRRKLIPRERAS